MRKTLVIAIGAFAVVLMGAVVARATEQPCHRDGSNVVCTKEGFEKLVDATIDFKAQAQDTTLKLTARERDLDTCITAKPQPPMGRTLLSYVAGIFGAAMSVASAHVANPTMQSALLGVGLVLIGGGAAFVIP